MVDPAWVGIIGALGGVALGGVIEHFRNRSTFNWERKWELRDAKRQRLEKIFELLYEVESSFDNTAARSAVIAATGAPPSPELPMGKVPWDRLGVLVSLYHRELVAELTAVRKAGEHFALACIQHGTHKAADRASAIEKMRAAHQPFAAALHTLRMHIEREVETLTVTAETTVR
jgi:hypothetical protein